MDHLKLAMELLVAARGAGLHLATAESCTGGMLGAAITEAPGASDIYERGFITYSNAAKIEVLGVSGDTLARFGAVSNEVAMEMAQGALIRSGTDLAVSVTGIAGPGGSENKPEGRVCFGLAREGRASFAETVEFTAIGRAAVRRAATAHALHLLIGACPQGA